MKMLTYVDLENAAPVVEVMGVTFVADEPQEVEDAVAAHLAGNPFFELAGEDGEAPKRRGRPPKALAED